jgi:hypothetical protein
VARPAVPARQPLAIEAPAPVPVRIGVPAGPDDLAMVAWPPGGAYPDWDGLAVGEVIPDRDRVRA